MRVQAGSQKVYLLELPCKELSVLVTKTQFTLFVLRIYAKLLQNGFDIEFFVQKKIWCSMKK